MMPVRRRARLRLSGPGPGHGRRGTGRQLSEAHWQAPGRRARAPSQADCPALARAAVTATATLSQCRH